MRGSFFGLNVALGGLYSAQRNLDIVGNNLNNVNTPGYSRQQGVQVASRPIPIGNGAGMLGAGSDVIAINRVRDEYLDFKYWSENVSRGEWSAKMEILSELEVTFNEPSSSGFTKVMDDFYISLHDLSKDPGSGAVRALVRERGETLAKYFNSLAEHFEKVQSDINYKIRTKVEEVNSLGTQIQQLNRQIYSSELDGSNANDLRDQRTLLVDKLSKIINVEANEVVSGKLPDGRDDKHFIITISGKALVDHYNVSKLAVNQRVNKLNADEDIDGLYDVGWEDGNTLNIKGGELRGYLDVRDGNGGQGNSPLYKGIPFYISNLNQFVRTFAMAFNEGCIDLNNDGVITPDEDGEGHVDGFGLNSISGVRFFTILGADGKPTDGASLVNGAPTIIDAYQKITAKNFSISKEIKTDYNAIATSTEDGQQSNNNLISKLIEMRDNPHVFSEGKPEDFMKSLIASLGVDSQQAKRLYANQRVIVNQIENRRLSNSGVSIDEEMANMVKFQHSYNASAKMITTLMEIYDTLINRLGVR